MLVVSKKSTFTLEDARTALRIMNDEAAARRLNDEATGVRQLLLTTRAAVAPAADAFLQGANANVGPSDFEETGGVAVMRWEQLKLLVQDGSLGQHLITSRSRRRGGNGDPKAPSFALPAWLVEERERGVGAVFDLNSPFEPAGDQPEAIKALSQGIEEGKRHQTLLGATGTVRSFAAAGSFVHPTARIVLCLFLRKMPDVDNRFFKMPTVDAGQVSLRCFVCFVGITSHPLSQSMSTPHVPFYVCMRLKTLVYWVGTGEDIYHRERDSGSSPPDPGARSEQGQSLVFQIPRVV